MKSAPEAKIPPVRIILRIATRRPEPDRQGDSSGTLLPEQNKAGYPTTSGKSLETLELIRKLNESATSAARDKAELGVTGQFTTSGKTLQTLKLIRKLDKSASLVEQDIGGIAHPGTKRRNRAAYVESDDETSTYEIFHAVEVEPEDPAGKIREISEARDLDSGIEFLSDSPSVDLRKRKRFDCLDSSDSDQGESPTTRRVFGEKRLPAPPSGFSTTLSETSVEFPEPLEEDKEKPLRRPGEKRLPNLA